MVLAYSIDYATPRGMKRVTSADKDKILRINAALRKQGKGAILTMRGVL